jgi:hypothetical protein
MKQYPQNIIGKILCVLTLGKFCRKPKPVPVSVYKRLVISYRYTVNGFIVYMLYDYFFNG